MLDFLTTSMNGKLAEWISALGALATFAGVWFVSRQIRLTKQITQLEFEDGLAKEYRELATNILTKALLGGGLPMLEYEKTFDDLFRYIDLTNEQPSLRARGRIGDETWTQWADGIKFNMKLPVFARAWAEIQRMAPTQFQELKRLLEEDFCNDPKTWPKASQS